MIRRILTIGFIVVAAIGALPAVAGAATTGQIHRDAADGSIDGKYTLTEMRAADRSVSAEQREYYGWEDVYTHYLRRLKSPAAASAPPIVVPVDSNRNGKIDVAEKAAAVRTARKKGGRVAGADGEAESAFDADSAEPRDSDNDAVASARNDGDTGGRSPLLWLIIGLPVLISLVGGWRFWRVRRAPKQDQLT